MDKSNHKKKKSAKMFLSQAFIKCKILASVGEVPPPTPTTIQVLMPNSSSGKTKSLGGKKETNTLSEMYFLVHHVLGFKYFFLLMLIGCHCHFGSHWPKNTSVKACDRRLTLFCIW